MLSLIHSVGSGRFSELGSVYRIKRLPQAAMVAVCSALGRMHWPGKDLSTGYAPFRLCLYSEDYTRLLAVFDDASYPINDVAIDASGNSIAIGTGRYDGGYFFEGELLLWRWRNGESRSLLAESREVLACRFTVGGRIEALLRPSTDEDESEHLEAVYPLELNPELHPAHGLLDTLEPQALAACRNAWKLGLAADEADLLTTEVQHMVRMGYEPRSHVWDCCWLDGGRLAVAHARCVVELWHLADGSSRRIVGAGHGVQLFKRPDQTLLVHEMRRPGAPDCGLGRSELHEIRDDELISRYRSDVVRHFSMSRTGHMLARDVDYGHDSPRRRPRQDLLLRPSYEPVPVEGLGQFDVFNHPIRIDGADKLYFLRGSPKEQHLQKFLCAIDGEGSVSEVAEWDNKERHLMTATACLSSKGLLTRAGYVHNPDPRQGEWVIDAQLIASARPLEWERRQKTMVTALALCEDRDVAVVASEDGLLTLIRLSDGVTVEEMELRVDKMTTPATALAVAGNRVAAATMTGSMLVFQL
jgi:hypothetical protein